ncbi:MAG: hypothetical protein ACREJO_03215 [Phycisphaerales bacterium]
MRLAAIVVCVSIVAPAEFVLAQGVDIDVGLSVQNGRLVTGEFADPPGILTPGERVFGGEMSLLGGAVFGDEPGFRAFAGTFSSTGTLTVQFRSAMRVWSGGNFNTLAAPLQLNAQLAGGAISVFTPLTDPANPDTGPLPGFTFDVNPLDQLHEHADLFLVSSALNPPPIPEGLYLVELQTVTTVPGIDRSLPFWIVFNYGMSEPEHDAAIAYVRTNLVPAPGAAALAGLGLFAARRRRR